MSLSDLLGDRLKNTRDDDQGTWRQFILDHLDYIAARSRTYVVDPEVINLYRFDLARFLKDRLDRASDIAWIVLKLNNLYNDFYFVEARELVVPSDDLIDKLYHSYSTVVGSSF